MCPFEHYTTNYFQQYIPNDWDLVITFFVVFSRFEYALKASGCVNGNENEAKANWDSFASSIRKQFQLDRTPDLQEAINYLHQFPPRKQVVRQSNRLGWSDPRSNDKPPTIFDLLGYIRTIRNNLFHGAKFQEILHESNQNDRNRHLLQSALIVLEECLQISTNVQQAFFAEIPSTLSQD
jgi:hypothetical protein